MRIGSSFALSAVVALCACGGGGGGGGGGGTCNPGATAAFTVSGTGISPSAVCVLPSGTVSFNNTSTTARTFASGDCTELNNLAIPPSASTPVPFGTTQKTCTFHDAANAGNTAFQGTVAVTAAPAQGPGY